MLALQDGMLLEYDIDVRADRRGPAPPAARVLPSTARSRPPAPPPAAAPLLLGYTG